MIILNKLTIIKQMKQNSCLLPILDPEQVYKQFQKQEQIQNKLDLLQTSVFKNFMIKKSKSVIHHSTSVKDTQPIEEDSNYKIPFFMSSESVPTPAVTSISFGISRSNSQTGRTLSIFSPRLNFQSNRRKQVNRQEQLLQKHKKFIEHGVLQAKTKQKIVSMPQRDSQTILRKNSLLLMNCLKTRYKQGKSSSHIGEVANATNNIRLGNFYEKTQGNLHYQQRFQYMQQAKMRLLQTKKEKPILLKSARISPLFPQPW